MGISINVDLDEVMDQIDTCDLVEELVTRKATRDELSPLSDLLLPVLLRAQSERDRIDDVLSLLFRYDVDGARSALRDFIDNYLPPHILAAMEALDDGKRSAAICELDAFVSPYVQPTQKELMKALASKTQQPPTPA